MQSRHSMVLFGLVVVGLLFVAAIATLVGAAFRSDFGPDELDTDRDSSGFSTLEEKVQFLEQYVTFRREYCALDFYVHWNSNGFAPGSYWIALVAEVPPETVPDWIPAGVPRTATPELPQLSFGQQPGVLNATRIRSSLPWQQITEWYVESQSAEVGRIVGVDRERGVVFYYTFSVS